MAKYEEIFYEEYRKFKEEKTGSDEHH